MKARFLLLSFALLAGVAADLPRRSLTAEDRIAILKATGDSLPEGSTSAQVQEGLRKDVAYVRYTVRKGGLDVVTSTVTLKKTAKGWEVESCAR